MTHYPSQDQQIIQTHAGLIVLVVHATQNPDLLPKLDGILKASAENGWTALVDSIKKILSGNRDSGMLTGLDKEDSAIVSAILNGIQNPSTLPDPEKPAGDPVMAAPGIAHMIHDASRGDPQSLTMLSNMAEQMSKAGGDMSRLGAIIKNLLDGEREPDILCKGMSSKGDTLVLSILEELGKLRLQ
jgi:hypothetical protein